MINTLYLPELREMLQERDERGLYEFCTALHPARTADYMQGLEPQEAWDVLKYAELPLRSEIFSYLEHGMQIVIIESADRSQIAELIAQVAPDDRVDILEDVDERVVAELMPLLPQEDRRDIIRLQAYREDTAGAMMTTQVAMLPETLSVGDALKELGRQSEDLETIYYLYIVDDTRHLRGVVSTRQLVSKIGKPDTPLSALMETDVVAVRATEDQEEVARKSGALTFWRFRSSMTNVACSVSLHTTT